MWVASQKKWRFSSGSGTDIPGYEFLLRGGWEWPGCISKDGWAVYKTGMGMVLWWEVFPGMEMEYWGSTIGID